MFNQPTHATQNPDEGKREKESVQNNKNTDNAEGFVPEGSIDVRPFLDPEDGGYLDKESPLLPPIIIILLALMIIVVILTKLKETLNSPLVKSIDFKKLSEVYSLEERDVLARLESLGWIKEKNTNIRNLHINQYQMQLFDQLHWSIQDKENDLISFTELLQRYQLNEEVLLKRFDDLNIKAHSRNDECYIDLAQRILLDHLHNHLSRGEELNAFLQKYFSTDNNF